jgi:hypothetical protein
MPSGISEFKGRAEKVETPVLGSRTGGLFRSLPVRGDLTGRQEYKGYKIKLQ